MVGIAVGTLTQCEEKDASYTAMEVMGELLAELELPCAMGFQVGHGELNLPCVLGAQVTLDAGAGTLTWDSP